MARARATQTTDQQQQLREQNAAQHAQARATHTADQQQQLRDQNAASMHKITLVSLDVLEAYIQNVGLTGCEEQRDRLKREKDMHLLWYLVLIGPPPRFNTGYGSAIEVGGQSRGATWKCSSGRPTEWLYARMPCVVMLATAMG